MTLINPLHLDGYDIFEHTSPTGERTAILRLMTDRGIMDLPMRLTHAQGLGLALADMT
jgi:hypothetical protein